MWRGICWVWLQQTVEPGKQLLCPTGMHCLVGGVSAGPETQAEAKYWSELWLLQSAVTTWPVWVWFHECQVPALNFSLNLKDFLWWIIYLREIFWCNLGVTWLYESCRGQHQRRSLHCVSKRINVLKRMLSRPNGYCVVGISMTWGSVILPGFNPAMVFLCCSI